jgi:hypothetical protein
MRLICIANFRCAAAAGLTLLLLSHAAFAKPSEASPKTVAAEAEESPSTEDAKPIPTAEQQVEPEPVVVEPEPGGPKPSESPEATEPIETREPNGPVEADVVGWSQRVEVLTAEIQIGARTPEAADDLYADLAAELWAYQDEVYEALRSRSPGALNQRAILAEMYNARMRLLDWVTPELRASMIGGGSDGMREFEREFEKAKLDFYFQTLAIPRGLRRIAFGVRDSPLDDLWRLLQLLFGIAIFRTWRGWAKNGIGHARTQVFGFGPRTSAQIQLARLLWYVHRLRGPLEWLALLFFASTIYEAGDLEEVSTLVWVVILWLLLTRFGLLLVDTIASRSIDGPASRNSSLRLRSLRLVTAWVLFAGLSLDLSSRYVGEGAVHAWVSRAFTLLLVPVLVLLLHWWRGVIISRLGEEARHSNTARRLARREKGLRSYVNAAAGAGYLTGAALLQFFVRLLSGFEGGRKIVAMLLRREVERDSQRESISEEPISEDLVQKLMAPSDSIIEGPFEDGLQRILALTETGRGAAVSVLAERGGGLSTFLRFVKNALGDSMAIVDCPPGGFEPFRNALAEEFGLGRDQDLTTALKPRLEERGIRVLAVDNFHRIARRKMGGLLGVDAAARISDGAGAEIIWVIGMTRAASPFITRARGDRAILQEVLELPAWSDDQLEDLFAARCQAAEIEPDYRRLVFPRQFDDGERTTLEERNRFGFRRVLWELSDGNAEVAMHLFCDSLRALPNGKLIARLPQPKSMNKVAGANVSTLLALRCLVECELATIDDLTETIRVPRTTVANAIAYCIQEGWIEEVDGYYQLTWDWYRTVTRVLIRRNLIAR